MNDFVSVVKQMSERFDNQLARSIEQAKAHRHSFVCYTQPIIKEKDGRCQMTYHIKSFKDQFALQEFIDAQKTFYYVLDLSQKGV